MTSLKHTFSWGWVWSPDDINDKLTSSKSAKEDVKPYTSRRRACAIYVWSYCVCSVKKTKQNLAVCSELCFILRYNPPVAFHFVIRVRRHSVYVHSAALLAFVTVDGVDISLNISIRWWAMKPKLMLLHLPVHPHVEYRRWWFFDLFSFLFPRCYSAVHSELCYSFDRLFWLTLCELSWGFFLFIWIILRPLCAEISCVFITT